MELAALRSEVCEANLELVRRGLVLYTFGNASGIDRERGWVVIKPSGVPYDKLTPERMPIVALDGAAVEGTLFPSSDVDTHLALYRAFPKIGGVVHTHSTHATSWAQAGRQMPCFGTTHADYFRGAIPVTQPLSAGEVDGDYEANTGEAIIRRFAALDPLEMPAVLVTGHGPFTWGKSPTEAAHNAVILEELARLALHTVALNPAAEALPQHVIDKHFYRKHGAGAYYGQADRR